MLTQAAARDYAEHRKIGDILPREQECWNQASCRFPNDVATPCLSRCYATCDPLLGV